MDPILVGKAITTATSGNVYLQPKLGNRHGLVAGATGTGKTVTLMTLAEGFSRIGVPVFLADVKGDVAGLAAAGAMNEKIQQRLALMGNPEYRNEASPVVFWDLYGKLGHPVRTTVSEMGPTLLGRILELNDTQAGVLDIVFKLADDRGLLLLDLEDLRALLGLVADERKDISTSYGLVSTQSIGAIQRALLRLEQEGAEMFFGEPALELSDLMRTTTDGRGVVNILAADRLLTSPRRYPSRNNATCRVFSEIGFSREIEDGNRSRPSPVNGRSSSSTASACRANGTRCGRRIFIFRPGMLQTVPLISDHSANRSSPGRTNVSAKNLSARRVIGAP